MTDRIRAIALSLFVSVLAIGIGIAALSSFLETLTSLQVATWAVTSMLMFAAGVGLVLAVLRLARSKPVPAGEVIEAQPARMALPEPRWFQPGPDTLIRTSVLDDKAQRIAQALRDAGLQPTRGNIKLYGGDLQINGNEGASIIYQRFVRWGWAERVSQGEPGRWKV